MKKIVQLILCCLPVILYAQKTVNVIAKNGLNLRESASENGRVIEKIPFGTDLTVLQNTQIACKPILIFKKNTTTANEYDNQVKHDLELVGTFLKVIYNGKMGFINSLYTCSVIPNLFLLDQKRIDRNEIIEIKEDDEINFYLLNQYFKVKKGSKIELHYSKKIDKENNISIFFTKKYPNGLQYTFTSDYTDIGSGGYTFILASKNLSFNEAIMMAKLLFKLDDFDNITLGFDYDKKGNIYNLQYYYEGGGTTAKIYKNKQGYWVLEFGSAAC